MSVHCFVILLPPPASKRIAMTIRSNSYINRHGENIIYFLDELIFSLSVCSLSKYIGKLIAMVLSYWRFIASFVVVPRF